MKKDSKINRGIDFNFFLAFLACDLTIILVIWINYAFQIESCVIRPIAVLISFVLIGQVLVNLAIFFIWILNNRKINYFALGSMVGAVVIYFCVYLLSYFVPVFFPGCEPWKEMYNLPKPVRNQNEAVLSIKNYLEKKDIDTKGGELSVEEGRIFKYFVDNYVVTYYWCNDESVLDKIPRQSSGKLYYSEDDRCRDAYYMIEGKTVFNSNCKSGNPPNK